MLGGVSGRVFCRFCIKFETEIGDFALNSTRNLYVFSDRFSITFVIGNAAIGCFRCYVCALPWHKIWNRNQICARWLQEFLGIKSALTRITHPQHPFSKGGGLAKRPQFAVPLRGAGVLDRFRTLTDSARLCRTRRACLSLPLRRALRDRRSLPRSPGRPPCRSPGELASPYLSAGPAETVDPNRGPHVGAFSNFFPVLENKVTKRCVTIFARFASKWLPDRF